MEDALPAGDLLDDLEPDVQVGPGGVAPGVHRDRPRGEQRERAADERADPVGRSLPGQETRPIDVAAGRLAAISICEMDLGDFPAT